MREAILFGTDARFSYENFTHNLVMTTIHMQGIQVSPRYWFDLFFQFCARAIAKANETEKKSMIIMASGNCGSRAGQWPFFVKSISWEGATTLYGAEVSKAYLSVDGGGFLFKVCIRVSGLYG